MRIGACRDGWFFYVLVLTLGAIGCGSEDVSPLNVGPDEAYAFGVEEWHLDEQSSGSSQHTWLGPAGEVLTLLRFTTDFGDSAYALASDDYDDLWDCCLHDGFGGTSTVREPEPIDSPPDADAAWFIWYYGDESKTVYNTYIVGDYTAFSLEFSSEVTDMTEQQVLGILDTFRILD